MVSRFSDLSENFDYHYNQFELGGIDCVYGGQIQDIPRECGLWDGLAPALAPSSCVYGSPK